MRGFYEKEVTELNRITNQKKYFFESDHSFSTYAKFFERLIFVTWDTHGYVCVSGGKNCC